MNDQQACIGDTTLVLQAAGLDPLSKVFTLNDFRRCMKLVGYANDKLIAKEHLRLIIVNEINNYAINQPKEHKLLNLSFGTRNLLK